MERDSSRAISSPPARSSYWRRHICGRFHTQSVSKDPVNGLTGYRAPKYFEFRDSLPETLVGKVLRRVLLEEEKQKQAAATS